MRSLTKAVFFLALLVPATGRAQHWTAEEQEVEDGNSRDSR
jgi:hypothetical protein